MTASPAVGYRWPRDRYDHAVSAGVFEDSRVELLDGEIVDMAPQSNQHSYSTRWLRTHLVDGLDRAVWVVGSHEPIGLSDWSEPEPDVWLARGARVLGNHHPGVDALVLVVEVSWSSEYLDRVRKLPLYAAAGVPEYWIVDLHRAVVHVHRSPVDGVYREVSTAERGDRLTVPETELSVDVSELLGP